MNLSKDTVDRIVADVVGDIQTHLPGIVHIVEKFEGSLTIEQKLEKIVRSYVIADPADPTDQSRLFAVAGALEADNTYVNDNIEEVQQHILEEILAETIAQESITTEELGAFTTIGHDTGTNTIVKVF